MANVDSDLTATNAASPLTAQSVLTVIAVNADGSPIGASGGGVVTPNVNLASFGNQPAQPLQAGCRAARRDRPRAACRRARPRSCSWRSSTTGRARTI